MKKTICALILIALLCAAATGEGLTGLGQSLPNPAALLGASGKLIQENYSFAWDYLCDAYTYPLPEDSAEFLEAYIALAEQAGCSVSDTTADGQQALRIDSPDGSRYALLFPEFQGQILLLMQTGLKFAPETTPTPASTPKPSPTPLPATPATSNSVQGNASSPHVEYQYVQVPCSVCHTSGKCSLCNGTGTYRLYGTSTPCYIYCQTCDGLGYYMQMQPVWVYD